MKPKRQRMMLMGVAALTLVGATALGLSALGQKKQYFFAPSDLSDHKVPPGEAFRLGGLVAVGSVKHLSDGVTINFTLTDLRKTLPVQFRGITPDLFREGSGVVAEGRLDASGMFIADTLLAKHDENYMPPEVAASLKKSGRWKPYGGR